MMWFDVFVQYWVTEAIPDGPNRSETCSDARESHDMTSLHMEAIGPYKDTGQGDLK